MNSIYLKRELKYSLKAGVDYIAIDVLGNKAKSLENWSSQNFLDIQ